MIEMKMYFMELIEEGSFSHASNSISCFTILTVLFWQVSADDFMKQLGHASRIIPLLHPEGDDELTEEEHASLLPILSSQFSHSDGVRGFFAVYLTSSESLAAEEVPPVLAEAVRGADAKVMVPLACKCFVLLSTCHPIILRLIIIVSFE